MAERAPLTDDDLRAIVVQEKRQALGGIADDELATQRTRAMEYYLGEPLGTEVPGRSAIIDTVVADTVDSLLPALLEIFCSGDEVVRFEPHGPEDEKSAEQATDYVNYIVTQDNNALITFYQWFKDALIQKNGFVKVYWDTVKRQSRETYRALSDEAFTAIAADKEVTIVAHEQGMDDYGNPIHAVVVEKSKEYGCPRIEPMPPEEFWISRDAKMGERPRACGHGRAMPISDLIEMGFDEELLAGIPDYLGQGTNDEALTRDTVDESERQGATDYANKQMRRVWIDEAYIRVDMDGDGVAELVQIITGGEQASVLLRAEPVDDDPFCAITPQIMSHRFFGRSVAELVMDLQKLKSTIWRQMMDNLYLANNPVTEVVEGQVVDMRQLLTRRPGGAFLVKQAGAVREVITPFVAKESFPMLEYIDGQRENRTGVTRYNQGLDADSLNKTARGVNMIMTAAQKREKLIARLFAETGVTQMFKKVLALVTKHQNEPRIVRLRGQFVQMDPRMWANSYDTSINVGLGSGDRSMQAMQLMNLLSIDEKIVVMQQGVNGPLVTADNIYAKLKRIVQYMGERNADAFYTDPQNAPPQPPPPPDPQVLKVQADMQKAQLEAQFKGKELELKQVEMQMQMASDQQRAKLDIQKAELERQIKEIELQIKIADAQFQREKDVATLAVDARKTDMEFERRDKEMDNSMEVERGKLQEAARSRRVKAGKLPAEVDDIEVTEEEMKEIMEAIGQLTQLQQQSVQGMQQIGQALQQIAQGQQQQMAADAEARRMAQQLMAEDQRPG
jgi:hypothetical protein